MTCRSIVTSFPSPTWNESDFSAYHVPSEVFVNPSQPSVLSGSSGWPTWARAGDKKLNVEHIAIAGAHGRHPLGTEGPSRRCPRPWCPVIPGIWGCPATIASARRSKANSHKNDPQNRTAAATSLGPSTVVISRAVQPVSASRCRQPRRTPKS
jgi:hypothetical protein